MNINIPFSSGEDYEEYCTSKNICPNCGNELITTVEPNYPDPNNYPTGLYCENCHFQLNY